MLSIPENDDEKNNVPVSQNTRRISEARKKLRWHIASGEDAKKFMIDPDMAAVMLERNKDDEWSNRPQSEKGLLRYIKNMQRGWKYTGETIVFSKSGFLLNGQHRLTACVKSGCAFECLVAFGIEDEAFKFMDIGVTRTAAHIFAIEEIPNYNQVAASARLLYGYKARVTWDGRAPDVENDVLLAFYRQHERLQDSLTFGRQLYGEIRVPLRWATFLHYICAEKSRAKADEFFGMLATGVGITTKSSTIYHLRKRLQEEARATQAKVAEAHIGAFVVKGWNANRRDELMKQFTWRTEQRASESFPRAE